MSRYSIISLNNRIGQVNTKVNMALAQLNTEYKYHDVNYDGAMTQARVIEELTQIPQGDTEITRDGDQCKMVSIEIKYLVIPDAEALETIGRIIIFKDTMNQGPSPVVGDILKEANVVSFRNLDNRVRFVWAKDIIINTDGLNNRPGYRKWFSKNVVTKLHYDGTAGTDTVGTHWYALFLRTEGVNEPSINFRCRIRFLDN